MAQEKGIEFLLAIGQDMGILPGKGETEDHYVERVILSAGARWMLTAVHNETEKVSIESVKKITQEKIDNYLEIAHYESAPDVQVIINCLYDTLLANGMFYHEQYNVRPVRNREIKTGTVSFIRGLLPEENTHFSGMAPYLPGGGDDVLADEFMLWQSNGEETLKMAWLRSSPQSSDTEIGEYLRADHQMYQKFYDTRRHDQAEITLGRTRKSDAHGFEYYMIKGDEIRRLTDDYINASVHAYVTLAIVNEQRKQSAHAKITKELVELELGYLLPEPDARFLRFVSWPETLQKLSNSRFKVSLHPRVWPIIQDRLNFLGFAVEEQHE